MLFLRKPTLSTLTEYKQARRGAPAAVPARSCLPRESTPGLFFKKIAFSVALNECANSGCREERQFGCSKRCGGKRSRPKQPVFG